MLEDMCKKYGKGKVYIALAVIIIIMSIIIISITYQVKIRFSIEGQRFKYVSKTKGEVLFKDNKDNEVNVIIDQTFGNQAPFSIADKYEVKYKEKVIKVDNSDWIKKGRIITLSNGSTHVSEFISVTSSEEYTKNITIPFDVQLVNSINDVYDFVEQGSLFVFLFLCIPLILLGLAGVVYPEDMWRFRYMFQVSGGEPTDWALFTSRLGGYITIAFALLAPVIAVNA